MFSRPFSIYKKLWILGVLIFLGSVTGFAQARDSAEWAEYRKLIQQTYIDGYYIPRDVLDAMRQLEEISSETGLEKFMEAPEDTVAHLLHFGLGKWILINWNLSEGSRYAHHLRQMGLTFPSDMVDFTIVSFHRYLHDKPLDIERRIEEYVAARKKAYEERKKEGEVISRDTFPPPDSLRESRR